MNGARPDPRLTLPPESKAPGAGLFWKAWPADEEPKAVVLIAHGFAEHLGRYEHVAAALNRAGYAVFAVDHWGHGRSDGVPGFVPAFSVYLDGMDVLLARAKETYPGLPRFLVGHSMGGLIAASFLVERQHEFAGAVLSGPAVRPNEAPSPALIAISRLMSALAPTLGVVALDASLVSRDPKVVAGYRADPLVYKGKIGARLGAEFFDAMRRIEAEAGRIHLPILLLHGERDGLITPEGSKFLNERIGSADRTLKIYQDCYHEIFNEPEKERVIADMIAWLDARLEKKAA